MLALVPVVLAVLLGTASAARATEERSLPTVIKYTGDFDVMQKFRAVRVLVPYSRTLYFYDGGAARGVVPAAAQELEKRLNQKYRDKRHFVVAIIPTTRDKLLSGLVEGVGDVAAGNLTITAGRGKFVDFTEATIEEVDEIVVTGPGAPELATLDDLAGKEVHVRASTSYYESLLALNSRFKSEGKPEIVLRMLPDAIEDEDKLDMVNAGLIKIAIVDDWLGEIWAKSLPKLKLHPELAVRKGGQVGWAVRKDSPKLLAVLNDAILEARKRSTTQVIINQAASDAKRLRNATRSKEMRKFNDTVQLFQKYGKQYGFDYLMLAAQGYQESRLDQNAKSKVGAIGVMQIMPATGKELGVGDIRKIEPNVHGGARYMSRLIERYFKDAKFDETNRTLFAFASYNAGPGNIAKARKAAEAEGLNPDVWFNSVEHIAAKKIGREPVVYVRNIYKYFVAYKLAQEVEAERAKAIESVQQGDKP